MLLMVTCAVAQSFTLKGRVTDDDGNGLELATVTCAEQGKVTMTNLKGEYQLSLQTADSVVVRFSMVGFKPRTRVLRNPRGTQTLQVQMHALELNEVVVTERRRQTDQMEQIDLKEVKAVIYNKGKQQDTTFNRNLLAQIIHQVGTVYKPTANTVQMARCLEPGKGVDHPVRQKLGEVPDKPIKRAVDNYLKENLP